MLNKTQVAAVEELATPWWRRNTPHKDAFLSRDKGKDKADKNPYKSDGKYRVQRLFPHIPSKDNAGVSQTFARPARKRTTAA